MGPGGGWPRRLEAEGGILGVAERVEDSRPPLGAGGVLAHLLARLRLPLDGDEGWLGVLPAGG